MAKSRITPEQKARRAQLGQLMEGAGIKSMEDIQELFKDMIATFVNQGLEGELDEELGYSKYDFRNKDTDNSRNGYSEKTLKTSFGDVDIQVSRDRKSICSAWGCHFSNSTIIRTVSVLSLTHGIQAFLHKGGHFK